MSWSRKGAFWILAAVVLWTAMPVSPCLLFARAPQLPACCRAMAKDCGSMANLSGSACCQLRRQDATLTPAQLYTQERTQRPSLLPHAPLPHMPAATRALATRSREAPPPLALLRGSSILRI